MRSVVPFVCFVLFFLYEIKNISIFMSKTLFQESWPQGYKTFFRLNSAEQELAMFSKKEFTVVSKFEIYY